MVIYTSGFSQTPPELKTARGNVMQYYISLPAGWTATKKWPVVMVLEAAEKEYKTNAERFVKARGNMPFIIVAPIHTSNGNQGRRDPNLFPYSTETWDYIDKVGDCKFNDDGIRQIMLDLPQLYSAELKVFLTGFEAGAHELWALALHHPEYLNAAAPVAGNYRARCIDAKAISTDPSRENLPIMSFVGAKDEVFGPTGTNHGQWNDAKTIANVNQFKNVNETVVPDKGHVPMPEEVLAYFNKLYSRTGK